MYRKSYLNIRKIVLLVFIIISSSAGVTQKNSVADDDTTGNEVSPRGAMLRSLILPGWGQLYNGKEIKAAVFATGEGALIYAYLHYHNEKNKYSELMKEAEENDDTIMKNYYDARKEYYMEKRNEFGWYTALAVILCITDAYVDAFLKNFDEKMKISFYSDYNNLLLSIKLPIN